MKKTTAFLLAATGFTALVAALVISVVPEAQAPPPSQPVRVTNTIAQPVPTAAQGTTLTRDADNPGRLPFYDGCVLTLTGTFHNCSVAVPSGKRLVIEHVSAQTLLPVGQRLLQIIVFTTLADSGTRTFFGATLQATQGGRDFFITSQQTRLYSDPGASAVTLEVYRDTVGGVGSADISIFGYLVDISQS